MLQPRFKGNIVANFDTFGSSIQLSKPLSFKKRNFSRCVFGEVTVLRYCIYTSLKEYKMSQEEISADRMEPRSSSIPSLIIPLEEMVGATASGRENRMGDQAALLGNDLAQGWTSSGKSGNLEKANLLGYILCGTE